MRRSPALCSPQPLSQPSPDPDRMATRWVAARGVQLKKIRRNEAGKVALVASARTASPELTPSPSPSPAMVCCRCRSPQAL